MVGPMRNLTLVVFLIGILASALGVVFNRNAILSALFLILAFFGLAGVYVWCGSPFLAAVQVLIYTGAIVVLFVFVVMLVNQDKLLEISSSRMVPLVAGTMVWFLALIVLRTLNRLPMAMPSMRLTPDLRSVAMSLFAEYLWPFEVLSCFLLVIIVGVYVLTREGKSS